MSFGLALPDISKSAWLDDHHTLTAEELIEREEAKCNQIYEAIQNEETNFISTGFNTRGEDSEQEEGNLDEIDLADSERDEQDAAGYNPSGSVGRKFHEFSKRRECLGGASSRHPRPPNELSDQL